VVRQAAAWRWDRGTYLCLLLAKELVGAPVPEIVLADLSRYASPPKGFPIALALSRTMGVYMPEAIRLHDLAQQGYGPSAALRMGLTRLRKITRHEIKNRYRVSETTPWFPAYYLRCVWDIACGNYKTLGQIVVGAPLIRSDIGTAKIILDFLEGNITSR
jgi:hypothetical protein